MLIFYAYHHIVGYHWRVVEHPASDAVPSAMEGRLHIPQPGDTVCKSLCGTAWRQDLAARDLEAFNDLGVIVPVAAPANAASRR